MKLSDLDGKVAIVTGAASGIGRASAQYLGSQGVAVVVADRAEDGAAATAERIVDAGGRAIACQTELTDEESIRSVVTATIDNFGGIDLLHNNAGVNLGPLDQDVVSVSAEAWDQTMSINLRGPMLLSKYVIPHMIENGGGSIVFTSSISGQMAEAGHSSAYCSSKAGVDVLVKNVATQYGRKHIRANGVAPGLVMTEGVQSLLSREMQDLYQRNQLVPGFAEPIDIAIATAFLLSDATRFINGQILNVDGGFLAHTPLYAEIFKNDG